MDKSFRQSVVDEYLNVTGSNMVKPEEFLAWLRPQEDHRVWRVFFGKDEPDAAQEFRLGLVRQFVAGLRIKVMVSQLPAKGRRVRVAVSMPAFISPVAGRASGGGYHATDVDDPEQVREFARQASLDLKRVHERHAGVATLVGVDVAGLLTMAAAFDTAGMKR
jgi:hypothetical protein